MIAFDAGSVSGAILTRGLRGPRLKRLARVPLEPGVLVPSPSEPNIVSGAALNDALGLLLAELGGHGRKVTVVLPDGIARVLVFEAPDGVVPADYARFRLGTGLPYPAAEAIVDVQPISDRRFLGVAVRRGVVEPYETLVASFGLDCERVDLAPVLAIDGLRRRAREAESRVDVMLGDAAFSLAAWQGGALRVFRSRRRDASPGEAQRVGEEVLRTAALAGDGASPRVRVVGTGASGLVDELRAEGKEAELGWSASPDALSVEAAEVLWLGPALL